MKNANEDSGIVVIDRLQKDQQFSVASGEKKTFIIFLSDSLDQEGDVRIVISGSHVDVRILGIIIGSGKQSIRLQTIQDHRKPESVSDLLIKSVLFDQSKFYYRGLIRIEEGAQKSNAYQKNQNLLMSRGTWADSRPYLEILANDVRCTHGATVGKIDPGQIHYLQTRGLAHAYAQRLLIEGYISDVLERIPDKKARGKLQESVTNRIHELLI